MQPPINKGDLVHVPAETMLLDFGEEKAVERFHKIQTPISLLVVSESCEHYDVLYNSEVWCIKKNKVNKIG